MDYKGTENNDREVAVITERKRLRAFMAADLYDTRQRLELTQAQMAELLDIDVRSYAYLEPGGPERLWEHRRPLRRSKAGEPVTALRLRRVQTDFQRLRGWDVSLPIQEAGGPFPGLQAGFRRCCAWACCQP